MCVFPASEGYPAIRDANKKTLQLNTSKVLHDLSHCRFTTLHFYVRYDRFDTFMHSMFTASTSFVILIVFIACFASTLGSANLLHQKEAGRGPDLWGVWSCVAPYSAFVQRNILANMLGSDNAQGYIMSR